jgi:ribose transport system substrate-binding protein
VTGSLRIRRVVLLAVASIAVALAFGTIAWSSGGAGGGYTPITPGKSKPTSAQKAALDQIPAKVRKNYVGYWNWMTLGPNPYANWTPPKPPWTFCYSSAFQGNVWRVEGLTVAQDVFGQLKKKGLAKGSLITADANNNASIQATQINNMVQQGCNVIFVMQPPSIGICSAVDNASKNKVLVVMMQTGTHCTNAIHSDFFEYRAGYLTAQWVAQQVHGSGNVVMCNGIPGVAAADTRTAAANSVFKQYPKIKIGTINSQWTTTTAKAQMLQYLATHPATVDGVWDDGTCAVPAGQALQQDGRPLGAISGFEGSCSWLAFWKKNLKSSIGFPQSGGQAVFEPWVIAMRFLAGQKTKFNDFIYPLPVITKSNFNQYYKSSMAESSTCNAQPKGGAPVPDSYYSPLFSGGKKATTLTYPLR